MNTTLTQCTDLHISLSCDGCSHPVAPILTVSIRANRYSRLCRFCRHSLTYGRLTNLDTMLTRIFASYDQEGTAG